MAVFTTTIILDCCSGLVFVAKVMFNYLSKVVLMTTH